MECTLSQTNMTAFQYGEVGKITDSVHTPYHTDISLVTVIPKCRGSSGLHVFDYLSCKWLDIECGMPDDCAVVFAGETLSAMTKMAVLGGLHEVAHIADVRISTPLQLLAAQGFHFDASAAASTFGYSPSDWQSIAAGDFVHAVSSTRTSSNFPRNMM